MRKIGTYVKEGCSGSSSFQEYYNVCLVDNFFLLEIN